MKTLTSRVLSSLILAGALSTAGVAQAASVTLTGWAFGSAPSVKSTVVDINDGLRTGNFSFGGQGGAFVGSLSGTNGFDVDAFITYCIELTENFSFSNNAMTNYSVVQGSSYFGARHGDAGIAERLGRLMTWVAGDATRVDSAAKSASLQLAIWNTIYDTDTSVTGRSGSFSDTSAAATYANTILAGAATVQRSVFEVFALERSGKQDFLLLRQLQVPEPASLALVAVALAGMGVVHRRRRQGPSR